MKAKRLHFVATVFMVLLSSTWAIAVAPSTQSTQPVRWGPDANSSVLNNGKLAKIDAQLTAQDLIEKIAASEKKIKTMEVHLDDPLTDGSMYSADWGYQDGKEYQWTVYEGYGVNITTGKRVTTKSTDRRKQAFDGEQLYILSHSSPQPDQYDGSIRKANSGGGVISPDVFLGYRVIMGVPTLSEALRSAEKITVREKPETIDGHRCVVIEAIGARGAEPHTTRNLRVWIDPQRDFRPLRIERYRSVGGNNTWKIIETVIDGIDLKEFEGIWFPVGGRDNLYHELPPRPPGGMSEAVFRRLPYEKQLEIGIIETAPYENGARKPKFYEETLRINKGIDPTKFKLEFSKGCKVTDCCRGIVYTVGAFDDPDVEPTTEAGKVLRELLDREVHVNPKFTGELISIVMDMDVDTGLSAYQWFAAIRGLVLIGSPAVPDLTAALERAKTDRVQSAIAFVLNAIGDASAVEPLINMLARTTSYPVDFLVTPKGNLGGFLKTHQTHTMTNPQDWLGPPVEEITFALEKITGHSEGHDHFCSVGNFITCQQAKSYDGQVRMAKIERGIKELRRQTAERWRRWWQRNQMRRNKRD